MRATRWLAQVNIVPNVQTCFQNWRCLTFTRAGTVERSFWSPSLGPTSTSVTDRGHLSAMVCMPRHSRLACVRRCGAIPNRRLQRLIMFRSVIRGLGRDHGTLDFSQLDHRWGSHRQKRAMGSCYSCISRCHCCAFQFGSSHYCCDPLRTL